MSEKNIFLSESAIFNRRAEQFNPLVKDTIELLNQSPVVILQGPHGIGKSSVYRPLLIRALKKREVQTVNLPSISYIGTEARRPVAEKSDMTSIGMPRKTGLVIVESAGSITHEEIVYELVEYLRDRNYNMLPIVSYNKTDTSQRGFARKIWQDATRHTFGREAKVQNIDVALPQNIVRAMLLTNHVDRKVAEYLMGVLPGNKYILRDFWGTASIAEAKGIIRQYRDQWRTLLTEDEYIRLGNISRR